MHKAAHSMDCTWPPNGCKLFIFDIEACGGVTESWLIACMATCCGHASLKLATVFGYCMQNNEESNTMKSIEQNWAYVREILEVNHGGFKATFLVVNTIQEL